MLTLAEPNLGFSIPPTMGQALKGERAAVVG
jgi:hypothetical protein